MLRGLSQLGRRFFGIIVSGVRRGLSSRTIGSIFERLGLTRRAEEVLPDVRKTAEAVERWKRGPRLAKSRIIPEDFYEPAKLKVPERYLTRVKVVERHRETGEVREKFYSIRHNVRTSPEGLMEWVKTKPPEDPESKREAQDWEIVDYQVVEGYRQW